MWLHLDLKGRLRRLPWIPGAWGANGGAIRHCDRHAEMLGVQCPVGTAALVGNEERVGVGVHVW